jgi:hypothetical protein
MEEWPTSSETTIIYLQNDVVSFCIFSILMKNYKNKLQNSSLLNVMRNFDQSNTLPEFDHELFIHCGVELAR